MLANRYRHVFDRPLAHLAARINVGPNTLTLTGLFVTIIAAVTVAHNLFAGGLLILAGGFFDILDGAVAKAHNKATDFGAFFDSVIDRYSDAILFLGFIWHFFNIKSATGICLSLGTMVGALLVSYTRARAEGLGKDCRLGIMERAERVVLLAIAALTGWVQPIMGIMLVLTHVTVVQRIYHVWKMTKQP